MDLQFIPPRLGPAAVAALATIRKEWEQAAEGESLVQIQASVGLLLLDVTARLGLNQEEQKSVLGTRLCREAVGKAQEH
jgi:hypothetical protein